MKTAGCPIFAFFAKVGFHGHRPLRLLISPDPATDPGLLWLTSAPSSHPTNSAREELGP